MMKHIWYFLLILFPVCLNAQVINHDLSGSGWLFRKYGDFKWLPAVVPGTVHTDLFKNGLIPDPFTGNNEKELQWIETEKWEYKTSFELSNEEFSKAAQFIQFNGLDTYAEVYLNDSLILQADNMFRSWQINVKQALKQGENTLYILFNPAASKGKELAKKLSYTLPGDERVFTRKAQYQYGWDWAPRFVTAGVYRSIALVSWDLALINDVQFVQSRIDTELAELEFIITVESRENKKVELVVSSDYLDEHIKNTIQTNLVKGKNKVSLKPEIKHPRLWWPNGSGEPFLYHFNVKVMESANVIDSTSLNIGLRTVEFINKKDSTGTSFYFKVNGLPLFMKGANYIPPHNFLTELKAKDYDKLVSDAAFANMNMLRVWGGGVYADDAFYEACNRHGILVWQDFMFACAMYPGDKKFTDNVTEEVTQQVKHLRNHPCLALWCGNNEITEGWNNWGWQKQFKYNVNDSAKIIHDYYDLFENKISTLVQRLDPTRAYWPSSPALGWGRKESLRNGDSHYWGVWWGMEPFETYAQKVPRFASEYGFQGVPALSTFKKIMPGLTTSFDSAAFKSHQKHPTGYQTIQTYMERDYKVPETFVNYIYVSQLLQAHGMKMAMESHRAAIPYCMGSLYWQLNDCWPGTSWSSIDFYGHYKALHYQAKRSFNSLAIVLREAGDSIAVYMVSDHRDDIYGKLHIRFINFNGVVVVQKDTAFVVDPHKVALVFKLSKKSIPAAHTLSKLMLNAVYNYGSEQISANHYFARPKDLPLEKPFIVAIRKDDGSFEITSDKLAKDVMLSADAGEVNLSDNFFDLLPGEKKIVWLLDQTGFHAEGKGVTLKAKSLFDSMHD